MGSTSLVDASITPGLRILFIENCPYVQSIATAIMAHLHHSPATCLGLAGDGLGAAKATANIEIRTSATGFMFVRWIAVYLSSFTVFIHILLEAPIAFHLSCYLWPSVNP